MGCPFPYSQLEKSGKNHPKSNFKMEAGDKGRVEDFLEEIGLTDASGHLKGIKAKRNTAMYGINKSERLMGF